MVMCLVRWILLLVIITFFGVPYISCTPENINPSSTTTPNNLVHPMILLTKRIEWLWNEIHDAIDKFILEYQSLHQVTVDVNKDLEKAPPYEMGIGKLSGMLRLRFSFNENDTNIQSSVFLKVPRLGEMFQFGRHLLFYPKEKFVYERILPLIQFRETPHVSLSPFFYGSTEHGTLILEDLQETGFRRALDLHDVKMSRMVLRSLAIFHAYSLTRVDQLSLDRLDNLTAKDRQFLVDDPVSIKAVKKFTTYVLPLLPDVLRHELKNMKNEFRNAYNLAFQPNDVKRLNVIIHGYLKQELVFFSDDPEYPTCKFVDFQNCRLGSPAIDVFVYLMSCVRFTVIEASGKNLLLFYLQELEKTLSTTLAVDKQDLYSLDELCSDVQKYKWFFIFRLITIVPLHWGRFSKFQSNSSSEDFYDYLFRTENYALIFQGWWGILNDCRSLSGD